jgi:hypothetical protein
MFERSIAENEGVSPELDEAAPPSGLRRTGNIPAQGAELVSASGRRFKLVATPDGERLTVRARGGQVLLRVLVTDAGPVLVFESADLEVAAAGTLVLSGGEVSIHARAGLSLRAGGNCTTAIAGSRHTRVGAADKLEAAAVQLQASEGAAEIRAARRIALDGEHIGLNDDPCPRPFEWSSVGGGPSRGA